MKRKFLIPLLAATVLCMAVATAAQALPPINNGNPVFWKKNLSTILTQGTKTPIIGWGTLKLESKAGGIGCKNAASGNVENKGVKPANEALSEVVQFATYECKATSGECVAPAEIRATALNLYSNVPPYTVGVWKSTNFEVGTVGFEEEFRSKTAGTNQIEVGIECFFGGEKLATVKFVSGPVEGGGPEGSSTPAWVNGKSAALPSEVVFDGTEDSGHLRANTPIEEPGQVEGYLIKTTAGSKIITTVSPAAWGPKFKGPAEAPKPGTVCVVKSAVTFPGDYIKVKINTTEAELGNATSELKSPAAATGSFPMEMKCGTRTSENIPGTTEGKVKNEIYADNEAVPLITLGP